MTTIFFNIWRKASLFFAVAMLLFCYTTLPDVIAYVHNDLGEPIKFVDKQIFFYTSAAIIIVFNLLMGIAKDAIANLDFAKINPNSEWAQAKESLTILIGGWFNAFMAIVNTLLVFIFLGLNSINRSNEQMLDRDYSWLLLFLAMVLIVLIFFLPIRILFTKPSTN